MPIFDAPIDIQHRLIVPRGIARLRREIVPVILVSTRPSHQIDAGSTAQDLSHIHWNGASVQMRIRLSLEGPVPIATKIGWPSTGLHDAGHIVAAAGFQQEHTDIRIFSQPARYHRTGGARSADDKVV